MATFVRPGNPKKIFTWSDLDNKNVESVLANPKTSGGARWNFVALWGAISQSGGGEAAAKSFISGVFKSAEVLPKDAREATERNGELPGGYRVFSPNVLTEMPHTVVEKNADKRGTR